MDSRREGRRHRENIVNQITFDELLDSLADLPRDARREAFQRMLEAAAAARKSYLFEQQARSEPDAQRSGALLAQAGHHMLAGARALAAYTASVGRSLGQDVASMGAALVDTFGDDVKQMAGAANVAGSTKKLWAGLVGKVREMYEAAGRLYDGARQKLANVAGAVVERVQAGRDMVRREADAFVARVRDAGQEVAIHTSAAYDLVVDGASAGKQAVMSVAREQVVEPARKALESFEQARARMVDTVAAQVAAARSAAGTVATRYESNVVARRAALQTLGLQQVAAMQATAPAAATAAAEPLVASIVAAQVEEVAEQHAEVKEAVDVEADALAETGRTVRLDRLFGAHVAEVAARVRAQEQSLQAVDDQPSAVSEEDFDFAPTMGM